jgi:hypothetical protein
VAKATTHKDSEVVTRALKPVLLFHRLLRKHFGRRDFLKRLGILFADEVQGQQENQRQSDGSGRGIGNHERIKTEVIFVEKLGTQDVRSEQRKVSDAHHERES